MMSRFFMKVYYVLSVPLAILFILNSKQIHKAHNLNFIKKLSLGLRMFLNTIRIQTATSYKLVETDLFREAILLIQGLEYAV